MTTTTTTTTKYYEAQGKDWYEDVLDDQGRLLYDMIEELCPEFCNLDADQCQEFMDELSDLGITTAQQFRECLVYESAQHNAIAEFAEWYTKKHCPLNIEEGKTYDWQATWETQLKAHFDVIEFENQLCFFIKEEEENK